MPGLNKIHPEMLKALDVVGLSYSMFQLSWDHMGSLSPGVEREALTVYQTLISGGAVWLPLWSWDGRPDRLPSGVAKGIKGV